MTLTPRASMSGVDDVGASPARSAGGPRRGGGAGDEAGGAQQTRAVIGDEIGELVVPWIGHVPLRRSVSRGGRRTGRGANGPCCTGASVGARNLAPWLWRSTASTARRPS